MQNNGAQQTGPAKFSKEDVAAARQNIKGAIELLGLVDDHGNVVCPVCGRGGSKKVRLFPGGGFQCYSSDWCNRGNNLGIDLLLENGWKFHDAVSALLGLPHGHKMDAIKALSVDVNGFRAVVDSEVYERIVSLGDVNAAVQYFGRWHISKEAVEELGTSVILDVPAMKATLLKEFGKDRLESCGVLRPGEDGGRDYWVINKNYPVLEPHRNLEGRVVGLQARASAEREARYKKHLAYSKAKKAAEAAGEEFREPTADERYVGKFSSLRGGQVGLHLVGGGLPRLKDLETGTRVYIVEGIKDLLAMRTMGFEAYALPGVGVAPPADVLRTLARFDLKVSFDADDGGDTGSDRLAENLLPGGIIFSELGKQWAAAHPGLDPISMAQTEMEARSIEGPELEFALKVVARRKELGLRCTRKRPPQGKDVADVLVDKHRQSGCSCSACSQD